MRYKVSRTATMQYVHLTAELHMQRKLCNVYVCAVNLHILFKFTHVCTFSSYKSYSVSSNTGMVRFPAI